MKFIAGNKNAPDIPFKLLEKQESDQLVIFCGAGISIPAGLPDFKGLVEKLYKEFGINKSNEEKKAIRIGQYDTALNLLEQTVSKNSVREALINNLSFKKNSDFSIYKAILELSKTKKGAYRLVTTNIDKKGSSKA